MKGEKLILLILIFGILYKLTMTWGGNFLFNMDNARDLVDVREMVELKKIRLTGPTSAIEGLFNGPAWYYLLAIPYIISDGDPYSTIILQIVLWAIGGFFLLKMVSGFGRFLIIPIGLLWIASDYISLATVYAFNPNPVTLLTPFFIYLLFKYLETSKLIFSILTFFIGGLFFNFEMNFGIFVVPIILTSLMLTKKFHYVKGKVFWMGSLFFIILLLPQLLFDLRHNFIMTNSVLNYLSHGQNSTNHFSSRFQSITTSFFNVFQATLMNHKTFSLITLVLFIPIIINFVKLGSNESLPAASSGVSQRDKFFRAFIPAAELRGILARNKVMVISLIYILIPFILYLIIPVTVNPWHLGGEAAAAILLVGFLVNALWKYNFWGKIFSVILVVSIIYFSLFNIFKFFLVDYSKSNTDPSSYKNEVAAIDYVYKYADGKNFKVYPYLPSVYDYPYQYLFWWYGQKKYGYVPYEYAYSPNKPQYISNKDKFEGRKDNFSGLVFLIKEPDRIGYRTAWENDFKIMEFINKEMVGPLEVEIRRQSL